MHVGTASIAENLNAVESLTAEAVQLFADHTLFASGRVEALVLGNASAEGAAALGDALRGLLTTRGTRPLDLSDLGAHRLVSLPPGRGVSVCMDGPNGDDDNSAHLTVFQTAAQDCLRTNAVTDITEHMLHRDVFHTLRTVQQIGYIVTTYVSLRAMVPHVVFLLQSTSVGAEEIGARVATFIREWRRRLEVRRAPPPSHACTSLWLVLRLALCNNTPFPGAWICGVYSRVDAVSCTAQRLLMRGGLHGWLNGVGGESDSLRC